MMELEGDSHIQNKILDTSLQMSSVQPSNKKWNRKNEKKGGRSR